METSLSVQNDAILKKAKWWIVSSLVGRIIVQIVGKFLYLPQVYMILMFLWSVIFLIGCVQLLKHNLSSIRFFAKMAIIAESITILVYFLDNFVWVGVLSQICDTYPINNSWSRIIFHSEKIIISFVSLMGLAALWKNKQIRANYITSISILGVLTFVSCVLFFPVNAWLIKGGFVYPTMEIGYFHSFHRDLYGEISQMLSAILGLISLIVQILFIYCYCKLLKTPSLMPTEDNPDEVPYSYRPTKIEIGFVVCVALFVGLICVSFLFV